MSEPSDRMNVFPAFFRVEGKGVAVVGNGEEALAKVRLLLNTRADIVLIAAGPHDATPQRGHDIVRNATTPDVLMVAIDGRLRKQNGVLVEPNEGLIRREGREAIARLRTEARWPPITN